MSKLLPPTFIPLTDEQETVLEPFIAQLRAWQKAGTPGMLLAQVFPDHMVVGLFDPARASELSTSGKIIRSAFDRTDVHYPGLEEDKAH